MSIRRKFLVTLAILSILGLIGVMLMINATVAGMYDKLGAGLKYESVLVPAATLVPTPMIIALGAVIVFAKNVKIDWILHFLEIAAWVQAVFVLAIPVLLAALENELNGPTVIAPGFGICISCVFALFFGVLREQIQSMKSEQRTPKTK